MSTIVTQPTFLTRCALHTIAASLPTRLISGAIATPVLKRLSFQTSQNPFLTVKSWQSLALTGGWIIGALLIDHFKVVPRIVKLFDSKFLEANKTRYEKKTRLLMMNCMLSACVCNTALHALSVKSWQSLALTEGWIMGTLLIDYFGVIPRIVALFGSTFFAANRIYSERDIGLAMLNCMLSACVCSTALHALSHKQPAYRSTLAHLAISSVIAAPLQVVTTILLGALTEGK